MAIGDYMIRRKSTYRPRCSGRISRCWDRRSSSRNLEAAPSASTPWYMRRTTPIEAKPDRGRDAYYYAPPHKTGQLVPFQGSYRLSDHLLLRDEIKACCRFAFLATAPLPLRSRTCSKRLPMLP